MAAVGWVTPCLGHVAREGCHHQKSAGRKRTKQVGAASYLRFIQLTLAPPERPYRSIKLLYLFLAHPHPVGDFLERYFAVVASSFLYWNKYTRQTKAVFSLVLCKYSFLNFESRMSSFQNKKTKNRKSRDDFLKKEC